MCEWSASDLLSEWRQRVQADLGRMGQTGFHHREDEAKVVIDVENPRFGASITAWSTGMLELVTRPPRDADSARRPELFTEQRHTRAGAEAVLTGWLAHLRGLLGATPSAAASDTPRAGLPP